MYICNTAKIKMLKSPIHIATPGSLAHPQPLLHVSRNRHTSLVLKRVAKGILSVLALVTALQLVYPANRALPNANFGGYNLGAATEEDILKRLAGVDEKTFTARTDNHTYAQSLGDLGVSIETEKVAKQLADYPIQERLVPFSFLFYQAKPTNNHLVVRDEAKLQAFAQKVAAENNSLPVEGSIANTDSEFVVTRSTPGRDYRAEDIARYFAAYSHQTLADEAYLPYSSIAPVNSFEYLEALAEQAEKLAETKHTLTLGVASYEVDRQTLRQAIRFPSGTDKKLVLDIDARALLPGLETAADGVFFSPTALAKGQELDWQASSEKLAVALKSGHASAEAVLKPVPWTGAKAYPATSKGLQQLIEAWKAAHASIEPAITFAEIGGIGRHASIDGDTPYFSASVYKVFPAWYVLKKIDQGQLDPAGQIAGGFNLADCFHNMIIVSDSKCSEAIVYKFGGWSAMDGLARDHGINGINLSNGVTVTANGMSSFMRKLDAGDLLSAERTTYLLDYMKRQKYRTGLPAGSAGEVADKVGYQPKTYSWHDAGIVYHPKGKYTLVVLTHKGASLPMLATLARQISDTLNR
jgi:beta-lactamase class A